MSNLKLVAFDVETRGRETGFGLQPFRVRDGSAWLTMCAICTGSKVTGQMKPDVEYLRAFLRSAASKGATIVGWNIAFDMAWLIALGLRAEVFACKWLDGMLLWKHLYNSPEWTGLAPASWGLKAAVAQYYPMFAGYGEGISFETDDPVELLKLADYNKQDSLYTHMLSTMFWAQLTKAQQRCVLIEAMCLPMVAESYVEGICMDRDAAVVLEAKLTDAANLAMVTLMVQAPGEVDKDVLASPTKLRHLLYKTWGLKAPKLTEKGAESTDRDALSQLAPIDPRAGLLNDYREATNNRTKFAQGTINSLDYNGDGCSRPSFRVFGTYSGRGTVSASILKGKDKKPTGVPLHQWKRTQEFRDTIEAPEGQTILEFDFSGQEFRWMGVFSKDHTMIQMCQPGEDAHGYMGSKIGQKDYRQLQQQVAAGDSAAKNLRQLGKVGNLSCQYRTRAPTLVRVARTQYKLPLTDIEAKAIHGTYRMTYPGVPQYWKDQVYKVRRDQYVETISGRRVGLGDPVTWKGQTSEVITDGGVLFTPFDNTWGCESTAINFPIQGSGADQKYLAFAILRDLLPKYDGRFYFELHDSIAVVVPDHYAPAAYVAIKNALSNLPYKRAWGVDLPVLFPVDGKAGKSWGSAKEPEWN